MTWQDGAQALAGGLMIGGAAALYLLGNGRIMGASGILGEVVEGTDRASRAERLVFLAALVLVPLALGWLTGGIDTHLQAPTGVLMLAGALVGLGTRMANGCTSGHGVCGIWRLAPRGIVASLIYMAAGAMVMAGARHVWGVV